MNKNNIVVVFSSHLDDQSNLSFKNHIKNTIGCRHDIQCFRNFNEFSLPELYNKALDIYSKPNNIIVFIHNDILFKTKNWGTILLSRFNSTDYDIIGVAGSASINKDGVWWADKAKLFGIVNHTDGINEWESNFSPAFKDLMNVVCIDGVFMAVNPDSIVCRFNENYGKFHYYDIPFCVDNYYEGCNIGVTTDIRIMHKSMGEVNQEWEKNRALFVEEFKDEFPIQVRNEISNAGEFDIKLEREPKVTVIIPTKNNLEMLQFNINSWQTWIVKYSNFQIIIADTGSDEDVILEYNSLLSEKVKLIRYDYYNFSKINNDVVKNHCRDSELILFCNDDVILLNDCLTRAVEVYLSNKDVGTIGIRLHYADNSIQHNGIFINSDGGNLIITHVDLRKTALYKDFGYYSSVGNTGAFLMIQKELFDSIGGFNESYIECFEDVELNLECLFQSRNNITICDAVAYHYESVTRNKSADKLNRVNEDYKRIFNYYIEKNK